MESPSTIARPPETGGGPESELAYRLRQQELLTEFSHFALKCTDVQPLLQNATQTAARGLQTDFAKVLTPLPGEGRLLVRAGVGWRPGVVGHATIGADIDSPAGYALRTGSPVFSNHLVNEERFRTPKLFAEYGITRAINVLIDQDSSPYGVLEVDSRQEGRFTEYDTAFLQGLANVLGGALGRIDAEEASREKDARFRDTFEQAGAGIAQMALDGGLLEVNGQFCEIVGYSREELLRLKFDDITHPDDLDHDRALLRRLVTGEIPRGSMDKRYIRKDGSVVWVNRTTSLLRDVEGRPERFVSVIEDIDRRKAAETAQSQLAAIIDSSEDAIIGMALNGTITSWNPWRSDHVRLR